MRNKRKIILWSIAIFSILAIGFYFWLMTNNNPKSPERPESVPKSATWIGGVDEGFWFEIISINKEKETYRLRIYNDYDGVLVMDADFKKDSSCDKNYPLDNSILQNINFFSFDKIGMIDNCELRMLKPAYGGTFVEMDKEIK